MGLMLLGMAALLWRRGRMPRPEQAQAQAKPSAPPAPNAPLGPPLPAEPRPPRRANGPEPEPEPQLARHAAPTSAEADAAGPTDSPAEPRAPGRSRAAKARAAKSGEKSGGTRAEPPRPLDDTLSLAFEPLRFSATLAHAVLPYRLSVTNGGETALGTITIAGDMIAAEPAAPTGCLTAQDAAHLPSMHSLPTLAPGETAELRGEFRLPLSAITPLRVGGAALMVPLVRLKVEAMSQNGASPQDGALCRLAQFVVGEPDDDGADRLHPFRLDLGPRSWAVAALGGLDLVA